LYQHTTGASIVLTDWSADGRSLCFWSGDTMFILPLTGERKAIALKQEEFPGRGGRFSPDGRFLAFNSNQSGRFQIYVKPLGSASTAGATTAAPAGSSLPAPAGASLPAPAGASLDAGRSQVSIESGLGGIVWRKDGKELFYLSTPPGQTMMAVDVTTSPVFEARAPRRLFQLPTGVGGPAQLSTVSSPDGQRFVFAVNLPQAAPPKQ
jgi:hypothetical protein